jgi:hypothetical protein
MTKLIKKLIRLNPVLASKAKSLNGKIKESKKHIIAFIELLSWLAEGRPIPPPPLYKHNLLVSYSRKIQAKTLIESGTYLGDTVAACVCSFKKIYSIEIEDKLFEKARIRFKNVSKVVILKGDSGKILPEVLDSSIESPIIFWLDGHFSAGITGKGELDTPIMNELKAILSKDLDCLILVDDAHCFGGQKDYPTLPALEEFIKGINQNLIMEIKNNIISIYEKDLHDRLRRRKPG